MFVDARGDGGSNALFADEIRWGIVEIHEDFAGLFCTGVGCGERCGEAEKEKGRATKRREREGRGWQCWMREILENRVIFSPFKMDQNSAREREEGKREEEARR